MARKLLLFCSLLISWQSACPSMAAQLPPSYYSYSSHLHPENSSFTSHEEFSIETGGFYINRSQHERREQPFEDVCGLSATVIPLMAHGMDARIEDFPWHAAIFKFDKEFDDYIYICGGTLVSKNKVITAGHCVIEDITEDDVEFKWNPMWIFLGKQHIQLDYFEPGVQKKPVIRAYTFPYYDSQIFLGDIAILTLSSDIEITRHVRPACLWNNASYDNVEIEGKIGTVVGWGVDENLMHADTLKMVHMPIVSTRDCLETDPELVDMITDPTTFCAGYKNGSSPNSGDSGGGLMLNIDSRWYLRGIVSAGDEYKETRHCDIMKYVVFTDVAMYQDFIYENIYL